MKYLLICLLFLGSCDSKEDKELVKSSDRVLTRAHKFHYYEHDWIIFAAGESASHNYSMSVVHDPECQKCKVK